MITRIVLCIGLLVASCLVGAAEKKLLPKPRSDVRVLIDVSGSMKENDPNNLRVPATNLLVNLFPRHSRAAILLLGDGTEPLVPRGIVNEEWRIKASQKVESIHSKSRYTDIGIALEDALDGWEDNPSRHNRAIILLTDGVVDIHHDEGRNEEARREITQDLIPRLQKANVTVYSIALSSNADRALLKDLAIKTDGIYKQANNAEQLQKSFFKIFESAVERDVVPIKSNRFVIDEKTSEFTAMIFHAPDAKPVRLRSPDKQVYSKAKHPKNIKWLHTKSFDIITLKRPKYGEWRIYSQSDPDNRVFVMSDLQLRLSNVPKNVFAYERVPLSVTITNRNRVFNNPEFMNLLRFTLTKRNPNNRIDRQVFYLKDDGEQGDRKANDGVLTQYVTFSERDLGSKELVLNVKSNVFTREVRRSLRVHVSPVSVEEKISPKTGDHQLFILPNGKLIDPASISIAVRVVDHEDQEENYNLKTPSRKERWMISLPSLEDEYTYEVEFNIKGKTVNGREFDVLTSPLTIRKGQILKPGLAMLQSVERDYAYEDDPNQPTFTKKLRIRNSKARIPSIASARRVYYRMHPPSPGTGPISLVTGIVFLLLSLLSFGLWFMWKRIERRKIEAMATILDQEIFKPSDDDEKGGE